MKGIRRRTVYLEDHRGSVAHLVGACRDVLWGIVERVVQEQEQQEEEDYEQVSPEMLSSFDLPVTFGSSRKLKRKPKRRNSGSRRRKGSVELPQPNRQHLLAEHNLAFYRSASRERREWLCVAILGIGPSLPPGEYAMVRPLLQSEVFEVPRAALRDLSLSHRQTLYPQWEADVYYQLNLGKPADVHEKYWDQRYRLFSRFDQGVRLDCESWYSLTYETIAQYLVHRCCSSINGRLGDSLGSGRGEAAQGLGLVLDCFSGCGGCTIPFAALPDLHVVAVDLDSRKLEDLRWNAMIYGGEQNVSLVQAEVNAWLEALAKPGKLRTAREAIRKYYLSLGLDREEMSEDRVATTTTHSEPLQDIEKEKKEKKEKENEETGCYRADLVILSPPWGGPAYLDVPIFDLSTMLPSGDCFDLVALASCVARNVVLSVPRNVDDAQIKTIAQLLQMRHFIEDVHVDHKFKLKLAYFGPAVARPPPPSSS